MKKKILALSLALTMTLTMVVSDLPSGIASLIGNMLIGANAQEGVSYTYNTLADGTIAITGCNNSTSFLEIPSQIDGKSVSTIAENAFKGNTTIVNVTIQEGIKYIEAGAFNNCTAMTGILIPSSLEAIVAKSVGFNGDALNDKLTIFGYTDTIAQTYATKNLIDFSVLATSFSEIYTDKNVAMCWVGDSFEVKVDITPLDSKDVVWYSADDSLVTITPEKFVTTSSKNTSVATVNIISKGSGSCTIYAKSLDGKILKSLELNLLKPASDVNVYIGDEVNTDLQVYIDVNQTLKVDADFIDSNNDDILLIVGSSDTKVFVTGEDENNNWTITGKAKGTATFAITTLSGRVLKTITVNCLVKATDFTLMQGSNTVSGGISLVANHQSSLSVKFTPSTSTDTVSWETSDKTIATVSQDGVITALKAGTCYLKITVNDTPNDSERDTLTKSYIINVTQNIPATKLEFVDNQTQEIFTKKTALVGDILTYGTLPTDTYSINKTPVNTSDVLTWRSSNTSVATVDAYGKITTKSGGVTVITALAEDQSVFAQFTLTVRVRATSMQTNPTSKSIPVGQCFEITPVMTPSNADELVNFTSSDTSIATIVKITTDTETKYYVNAKKAGTVTISAVTEQSGVKSNCTVTVVEPVHANNVTLEQPDSNIINYDGTDGKIHYILNANSTLNITAEAKDTNQTGVAPNDLVKGLVIDYEANKNIVSAEISGNSISLKALKAGTVDLRITTYYNTLKQNSDLSFTLVPVETSVQLVQVHVVIPCTSINRDWENYIINEGVTQNIKATRSPSTSTDKLLWESSDTGIATVDQLGNVTGIMPGKALITCTPIYDYPNGTGRVKRTEYAVTFNVEITKPTNSIVIEDSDENQIDTSVILKVGDNYSIKIIGDEPETKDTFTLTSSSASIAKITKDSQPQANVVYATINAVKSGTATITVATSSGISKKITVIIIEPAVSLTPNTTEAVINLGSTKTLTVTLAPTTSNDVITWSSSNPQAVSISTVTGKTTVIKALNTSNEPVVITATSAFGASVRIYITVKAPATAIKLTSSTLTLGTGDVYNGLNYTISTAITGVSSTDNLTWTSSNSSVVSVNKNGVLTAISSGTAVIKVTTDSGKYATCSVTVKTGLDKVTLSSISTQTYTGTYINPSFTITYGTKALVLNTDYTVTYTNNINVGTATITIVGKGNYSGTITKTFIIAAKSVSALTATLSATSYTYDGIAKKPVVTIKYGTRTLKLNTEYTVTYTSNINAGTATVTITGKGNYSGTLKKTFKIAAKSISTFTATLSTTSYTYSGAARKPAVTLKYGTKVLKLNTDYIVSYSSNINPGTATATITGKGNYSGTIKKTYTIKLGAPTLTLTAGAKKATIKWGKVTGASGYEVYMSSSKSGTYSKIKTATASTYYYTKIGLTKGKTYYFKVRTYKYINGKKVYSAYSTIKSVRVL